MSLNKSATRRLSLLAGASLILSTLTVGGAVLAPTRALAANECGDPNANGAASDVLTCPPGTYATGIDYSTTSNGDLTVVLRDRVNTGTSNTAGSGPIVMHGDAGENMSLLREDTVGVFGDPRIVNTTGTGRAIHLSTLGDGAIVINLTDNDPTASEPTTPAASAPAPMRITASTDAIRAEANGSGDVAVTIAETGTQSGTNHVRAIITAGSAVGGGGSGVYARSTTGAIAIDTRGATFSINGTNGGAAVDAQSTSGNVTASTNTAGGRLYGIFAQTGGAGSVTLNVTAGASANGTTGLAGIQAVSGTGGTLINITGGTVSGGAGPAIRASSTSTSVTSAVNVQNTGGTVNGRVDFSGTTAGGVTFNNNGSTETTGRWLVTGASLFSNQGDTLTMAGAAANSMAAGSSIAFGGGSDTFNMGAVLVTLGGELDFGAGTDTLNVSGTLSMNGLTLTDLEALNLSGVIYMGNAMSGAFPPVLIPTEVDGKADDVLRLASGTFTGSGSARVVMDVQLGNGSQVGCETITVADCLNFRGASTAGATTLTVNQIADGGTQGGFDPVGVTLVDVSGAGTSAVGHFVLDPNSDGYIDDPLLGGALSRPGLFRYALHYDPDNQRHVLVGLPRSEVMEYAMLSGAAQSIWHLTAETVTDRQTDLRERAASGAVWLRAAGEYTKRDGASGFGSFGETFAVDTGHKLYAGTIMGGMDLITGHSGGYDYIAGVHIGYVASSFDLNASETSGRFSGATGGVYGGVWTERFFLDGTFNMNGLTLDYDAPGLDSKTNTYTTAFGARLDGGMRWPLSEGLVVEPLVSLAFARTSFEEISLSGGEVKPADAHSRRGALGLRFAGTLGGEDASATYFVAGRAWNEFDGEGRGVVTNPGVGVPFADEFSGGFGEAEAGINLYNAANTLSGFLSSGVKFKDGYSAVNLSLGVRMAW